MIRLLPLLLTACATLPTAARPAPDTGRAALHAWVAAGYPAGDCAEPMERLRVVVVDDTRELCGAAVNGCRASAPGGFLGLGDATPLLVMRRAVASTWLLAHELVHLLAYCSGYAWRGDPDHTLPELWSTGGAEGAVERAIR